MNPCANCNGNVGSGHPATQCEVCQRQIHFACIGLTGDDTKILTRNKSRCIKILCNNCSDNVNQMNTLKSSILELTIKITDLEKKLESAAKGDLNNSFEEIVNESVERMRRSKNIIVHGVAEPSGELAGRKASDATKVGDILSVVLPNEVVVPKSVFRIGKGEGNRIRPLKIVLDDSDMALKILKNKRKLATSSHRNINITNDKTPREIDYIRRLSDELKEREDKGESNLTIKYLRGIPKIVEKNLDGH